MNARLVSRNLRQRRQRIGRFAIIVGHQTSRKAFGYTRAVGPFCIGRNGFALDQGVHGKHILMLDESWGLLSKMTWDDFRPFFPIRWIGGPQP